MEEDGLVRRIEITVSPTAIREIRANLGELLSRMGFRKIDSNGEVYWESSDLQNLRIYPEIETRRLGTVGLSVFSKGRCVPPIVHIIEQTMYNMNSSEFRVYNGLYDQD